MPRLPLVCLLSAATGLLNAADDLRVGYTFGAEEFETEVPGVGRSEHDWDDSSRISLGLWSVERQMWGLVFVKQDAEYEEPAAKVDFSAIGARLCVGSAVPISQGLVVEFLPYLGWSRTELDLSWPGGGGSDSSWMWEYGVELNLAFAVSGATGLVVGGGGGYGFTKGEFEIEGTRDLDQQGLSFNVFVGWRF